LGEDKDGKWGILKSDCPSSNCGKMILHLVQGDWVMRGPYGGYQIAKVGAIYLARPKGVSRNPVPPEVPKKYSEDYLEACAVITDSPKASAALSRRCLQLIIRDVAGIKKKNLDLEIEEVIKTGGLPSLIAESLDAVRTTGNFAAHPIKSTSTGEIVPVEVGEAEWNLDVLESLFDFYFVQPEILKRKRAALNAKLKDAGKPPLK
jgi:hypothetical protein